jgi:hypothetical protein
MRRGGLGVPAVCLVSLLAPNLGAAVTVEVFGDSTLSASAVAWWPSKQVLVVYPDRRDLVLGFHKIRRIVDEAGTDRTDHVLQDRKVVGNFPEGYQPRSRPRGFNMGKAMLVAGAPVAVFLLLVASGVFSETHYESSRAPATP